MRTRTPRGTPALGALLCWGAAPYARDGGLLVLAAAVLWARSLDDDQPAAGPWLVAGLGALIQLAWLPAVWADGVGGGGGVMVWLGASALQALPALLAVALASRARASLGLALASGLAWAAAEGLAPWVQPLPTLHAGLVAEHGLWLWPVAIGGTPLLTGLLAAWGAWAWAEPRRALFLLLAATALGAAVQRRPDRRATVRVAVVQPDLHALDARVPSNGPAIEAALRALIEEAARADAQLVVLPEGAWPHDPGPPGSTRRGAFERALAGAPPTLIGATAGSAAPRQNVLVGVTGGAVTGTVAKARLVPLWERAVLGLGRDAFAPGDGGALLEVGELTVGALICYEDLFPQRVRATHGADLLVSATNDSWLGRAGRDAHHAAARLAAVQSGSWTLRAALDGRSAAFDHVGAERWGLDAPEAHWPDSPGRVGIVEVPLGARRRLGLWLGSWLAALAALVAAAASLRVRT